VRSISLPGLIANFAGPHGPWHVVGGLACLGIVALLMRSWRDADPRSDRFPLQFAAAVCATLLVSPHALFYEAGLLVLPVLALIDHWGATGRLSQRASMLALGGLFVGGQLWPLAEKIGFEPLAALPVIVGVLVWRELAPRPAVEPERRPAGARGL
jgi:hypothetical protein